MKDGAVPKAGFRFNIDRGGTFTDVYAETPGDSAPAIVMKLLSQSDSYDDAAREGIRRVLEECTGIPHPADHPIDTSRIESLRIGTTIATNALLERKGTQFALITTKGFADLLEIGDQSRPDIFALDIDHPSLLHGRVVEIDERVRLVRHDEYDDGIASVKGITGELVKVLRPANRDEIRAKLQLLLGDGVRGIAVMLMHSYTFRAHEQIVGEIAKELGFDHISLSSSVLPMVKIVSRGYTASADAYLTPCIFQYTSRFCAGFDSNLSRVDLTFMQSDGGLAKVSEFSGSRAILSGPAAGVIGYARTAYDDKRGDCPPKPVIGFDMGGTSTDVSRYHGRLEHIFENVTAGITILAPQLDINTVAAGGGSCLTLHSGMFHVGPDSAGALPGPVCYGNGGPLTITDANLILGRIIPHRFPNIFGPACDQPLDASASRGKFVQLCHDHPEHCGDMSIEEVAFGFVQVANEAMSRPIRNLTQSRGHDITEHMLACFGGAGGQHCCAIAAALGIRTIFVHRYSGILSAFGLSLANVVYEEQEPCARPLLLAGTTDVDPYFAKRLSNLSENVQRRLRDQGGFSPQAIRSHDYLNLRYDGTDQAVMTMHGEHGFMREFVSIYEREYGFTLDRPIVVDDVRVRGVGVRPPRPRPVVPTRPPATTPVADEFVECWFDSGSCNLTAIKTPVFPLSDLFAGDNIAGPAIIVDCTSTIVVEPNCSALISPWGDIAITVNACEQRVFSVTVADPILLSIFGHRFMGIAEQMGRTLQRTAISTNIKERLDFSCAIFGPNGGLVANAPHLPVHLGAMQEAVKYQLRVLGDKWKEGEIVMSNHPMAGGSHLPDITIITPVYTRQSGQPVFFVASRGHHSDIGGITPGSMPPFSKYLHEEGAAVKTFKIVQNGVFNEEGARHILHGSRNLSDNISDLRAQVAANNKGVHLVGDLIEQYSLEIVHAYMSFIQDNAEAAVREMLIDLSLARHLKPVDTVSAVDYMDDGSPIKLAITIDRSDGSAVFDFTGTGSQLYGNCNAPPAITLSAIIFCLRCLVRRQIPLNQGCLNPIRVIIPPGSLLCPSEEAAVVGGNVQTSQRITDVILLAFESCAASQGCMNNLTFGSDTSFGYYETIAGGAGAGPSWTGRSAVHTHMTNTRITDPEILERRYPVLLREFAIRKGSGGTGQFCGGDGVVRELQFLRPLTVSILSERRSLAPYGMHGGGDGERGRNEILRAADGRLIHLAGKDSYPAQTGDCIRILSPGGGGYGCITKASSRVETEVQTHSIAGGSVNQFRRLQESA